MVLLFAGFTCNLNFWIPYRYVYNILILIGFMHQNHPVNWMSILSNYYTAVCKLVLIDGMGVTQRIMIKKYMLSVWWIGSLAYQGGSSKSTTSFTRLSEYNIIIFNCISVKKRVNIILKSRISRWLQFWMIYAIFDSCFIFGNVSY